MSHGATLWIGWRHSPAQEVGGMRHPTSPSVLWGFYLEYPRVLTCPYWGELNLGRSKYRASLKFYFLLWIRVYGYYYRNDWSISRFSFSDKTNVIKNMQESKRTHGDDKSLIPKWYNNQDNNSSLVPNDIHRAQINPTKARGVTRGSSTGDSERASPVPGRRVPKCSEFKKE